MIHVAPCSCELHVRIRELEAELAEMSAQYESVRVLWLQESERAGNEWRRAAKAEALVAELLEVLRINHVKVTFHEAREREEC